VCLAWKCLFRPRFGIFGPLEFGPLNGDWEWYQQNLQKTHCAERRRMTYRSWKSVLSCDLCAWRWYQKRQRNLTVANCIRPDDHPHRRIEIKVCIRVVFGGSCKVQVSLKSVTGKWFPRYGGGVEICHFPLLWQLVRVQLPYNGTSRDLEIETLIWRH